MVSIWHHMFLQQEMFQIIAFRNEVTDSQLALV